MIKESLLEYDIIFEETAYQKNAKAERSFVDKLHAFIRRFYEKRWNNLFHFAPRFKEESRKESLMRHEHFLAIKLGLNPTDRVLDVGCGFMRAARNIARISGAKITGLMTNHNQEKHCAYLNKQSSIDYLLDVKQSDFRHLPFEADSFDKIYAIESLCHAPNLKDIYQKVYDKLKPGGKACFYEWALTDKYDPMNKAHVKYKEQIEYGCNLNKLRSIREINEYIDAVGFEKVESVDLVDANYRNNCPWYTSLQSTWAISAVRQNNLIKFFTQVMFKSLETIGLFPVGMTRDHHALLIAEEGLKAAGMDEIFTPMYMVVVEKPYKNIKLKVV